MKDHALSPARRLAHAETRRRKAREYDVATLRWTLGALGEPPIPPEEDDRYTFRIDALYVLHGTPCPKIYNP